MHRIQRATLAFLLALAACSKPTPQPAVTHSPEPALTLLPSATAAPTRATADFTPVPAATTGPTPTPIVYVIRAGDTLLAIAVQYGVTVEAILANNPGISPRVLQPGTQLTIPPPDAAPTPPSQRDWAPGFLPTPTPLPLRLGPITCYATPAGGQMCFGEVFNEGPVEVTNVAVQISLPGPDGMGGPVAVAYAPLDVLRSGGRAPLSALFAAPPEPGQTPVGLVLAAEEAGELSARVADLVADDVTGVPGVEGGYEVAGLLLNENDHAVSDVRVVVTLYEAAGEVRGYRTARYAATIEPGFTLPFEVLFTAPAAAAEVSVVAQGRTD